MIELLLIFINLIESHLIYDNITHKHIKHKCIHDEIIKNHLNFHKKNIVTLKYKNHPYNINSNNNDNNNKDTKIRRLINNNYEYNIWKENYNNIANDVHYIEPPFLFNFNSLSLDSETNDNNYYSNIDLSKLHISKNSITNTMKPIRIVPYWNYLENKLINRPNDLLFVKELVSACINYINKFVYVEPVIDSLYHKKYCSKNLYIKGEWRCVKYWNGYDTCGTVKIPDEHFENVKVYNTDKSGKYTETGGPGIKNADFILYVSAHDDSELNDKKYCKGLVAGWSMACAFDQYGRPIAAAIQLCTHLLKSQDWHEDIETTLHELMHGMIMSGLWDMFWDKKRNRRYTLRDIMDKNSHDNTIDGFIATPVVKNLIREHLNCDTAKGAPVKGGHFSEWYLNTELMIPVNYQGRFYISSILLGLMIDSGWYGIDMNYAEPFRWGYKKGCNFWNNDCIDKNTHKSNDNDIYWCDGEQPQGCTSDYQSPAKCQIFEQTIPIEYQYFNDNKQGGYANTKFCPFRVPYKIDEYCVLRTGQTNSRCIQNKLKLNNKINGDCFKIECNNYDDTRNIYNILKIYIGNDIVICNENNQNKWINVNSPILKEIKCPLINNVCVTKNPLSCKWGFYSIKLNKCICSVGFTGINCDERDTYIVPNAQLYTPTTQTPTDIPTTIPTDNPTNKPTYKPTILPTNNPTKSKIIDPNKDKTSTTDDAIKIGRYKIYLGRAYIPTARKQRNQIHLKPTPRPKKKFRAIT